MIVFARDGHDRPARPILVEADVGVEKLGIDRDARVRRLLLLHGRRFILRHACRTRRQRARHDSGDRQDRSEQHGASALIERRRSARIGENTLDPSGQRSGARHRYAAWENWRAGGHFQEDLRIERPIAKIADRLVVADRLREFGQSAPQPPTQRIEPENRSVHAGCKLNVEVAAPDMRRLVRDNGGALHLRPLGISEREQNDRTEGCRALDVEADADVAPACPGLAKGRRFPDDASGDRESYDQSCEEYAGRRRIGEQGERPPVEERWVARSGRLRQGPKIRSASCGRRSVGRGGGRRGGRHFGSYIEAAEKARKHAIKARRAERNGRQYSRHNPARDWHGQGDDKNDRPGRQLNAGIAQRRRPEAKPDDDRQHESSQSCLQQRLHHHALRCFALAIFSASR